MSEAPWLTIVGINEDGRAGLCAVSQDALHAAQVIFGPPRHLALLGPTAARQIPWPVPFTDGIAQLRELRGQQVVALVSGDPFWFGAGTVLARHFKRSDWRALPNVSIFAQVASTLGWALDSTICLGLHAAPLTRMRPHLAQDARLIVLVRDGAAVSDLAAYLQTVGFAASRLDCFEALGADRQIHTRCTAQTLPDHRFAHPVCVAITCQGDAALPQASGVPDSFFESDGTMTKQPIRALTLAALGPRPYQQLWDIGAGSGSISIEWLLAHPTTQATCIEPRAPRVANITRNAVALGVDRLRVVHGTAPEALAELPAPDAVFIGGGLSQAMLVEITDRLVRGTRLVVNAVTLETEALLSQWHAKCGGDLNRFEISTATRLGTKHAWRASLPIVQWSITL